MRKLAKEFVSSLVTVILAILAIGLFISSGATLMFYAAVVIAIIVGFYNAWMISKIETDNEKAKPSGKYAKKQRTR